MSEDMYMISVVFGTAIVIVLGLPLVRAYIRKQDRVQIWSWTCFPRTICTNSPGACPGRAVHAR